MKCIVSKFIKKFLMGVVVSVISLSGVMGVVKADEPLNFEISGAEVQPSSEVVLDVNISNVPEDGVATGSFVAEYDKTVFKLTEVRSGSIIKNPLFDIMFDDGYKSGAVVAYVDYNQTGSSHITQNGKLCQLVFSISDKCTAGDYSIKLMEKMTYNGLMKSEMPVKFYTSKLNELDAVYGESTVKILSDGQNASQLKIIKLKLGDPNMSVNGLSVEIDPGKGTKPESVDGRTMLPIRAVIEALGGNIKWDEGEKKISIALDDTSIDMWIDKTDTVVNGNNKTTDVSPRIINGRTFLPVRFVSENAGCSVKWDGETQTVTIKK